jgi:membrane-associated phospholipid phosphatase
VAERHYGWTVGLPAYVAAGLVGASRIQQNKHFLSDVIAGATVGYIVGRTVVRVNSQPAGGGAASASVSVVPLIGRRERGLRVALAF